MKAKKAKKASSRNKDSKKAAKDLKPKKSIYGGFNPQPDPPRGR
jgi:hypothetical protein